MGTIATDTGSIWTPDVLLVLAGWFVTLAVTAWFFVVKG